MLLSGHGIHLLPDLMLSWHHEMLLCSDEMHDPVHGMHAWREKRTVLLTYE